MSKGIMKERRHSQRCRPRADLFIALKSCNDIIGKICDIGRNGVSFEYSTFGLDERTTISGTGSIKVVIFNGEPTPSTLQALRWKMVYDIAIKRPSFSGIETRRCGLRFDRLSPLQTEQLEGILARCEIHHVPTPAPSSSCRPFSSNQLSVST